jgi:hypothetical protein
LRLAGSLIGSPKRLKNNVTYRIGQAASVLRHYGKRSADVPREMEEAAKDLIRKVVAIDLAPDLCRRIASEARILVSSQPAVAGRQRGRICPFGVSRKNRPK